MELWEFFVDESYNNHVFCVGGFLAHPDMGKEITEAWRAPIDCENRRSAIKGFHRFPVPRHGLCELEGVEALAVAVSSADLARLP
jgi:hypothetical protein